MTWRARLPTIGGLVLLAYLLVWVFQLVLLYNSPESFDRVATWWDSPVGRGIAGLVLLAGVYHLLEGLRRVLRPGWVPAGRATARPRGRADRLASVAVPFLTWALVLPGWAVLLRPWLEGSAS